MQFNEIKKTLLILGLGSVFTFLATTGKSQPWIVHEGYILKKDGTRAACLIKEDAYQNYMHKLTFRLLDKANFEEATPYAIQGFGIPSKKVKYVSFDLATVVEGSKNTPSNKKFLKHLEKGPLNLYEYKNLQTQRTMFFVQKGDGHLERLMVLKVRETFEGDKIVDTLTNYDQIRGPRSSYKIQKVYLAQLSKHTPNCPHLSIDQGLRLERKQVQNLVAKYNRCKGDQNKVESNFGQERKIRISVFGVVYFKESQDGVLIQPGGELEYFFSQNNTISVGLGITSTRVKHSIPGVDYYSLFGSVDGDDLMYLPYLKLSYYFSPGSRFKPFTSVYLIGQWSKAVNPDLLLAVSFGGGLAYQIKDQYSVFTELNSIINSPNLRLGGTYTF